MGEQDLLDGFRAGSGPAGQGDDGAEPGHVAIPDVGEIDPHAAFPAPRRAGQDLAEIGKRPFVDVTGEMENRREPGERGSWGNNYRAYAALYPARDG